VMSIVVGAKGFEGRKGRFKALWGKAEKRGARQTSLTRPS
jgi:hypothetical protein